MRFLIAALLVFAVSPAAAGATSPQALRAALPKAQAVAEARWGADDCTGRVVIQTLTFETLAAARLSEGAPDNDSVEDATPDLCRIRVALDRAESRTHLCSLVVHGRGHLHGLRFDNAADPVHSRHRSSVMSSGMSAAALDCMRAFVPYGVKQARQRGKTCTPLASQWQWSCGAFRVFDAI